MKLSLDALAVLDAIDRKGSFAAAADELHRVPSAITYTVQKLEQDLDLLLFDRRGHRAVLTEAGAELLREGRHLLRAASALEARVKRVATGWETELRIAVTDLIPLPRLFPLVREFHTVECGTRLRVLTEVYGGCWDALAGDRADLVIGAPGDGPAGGGYATRALGHVQWVFAVRPDHPLARVPQPIRNDQLLDHRAVSAADSSRSLPPRTSGLLSGQDVFTVPDIRAKRDAQVAGLGGGFLPLHLIGPDVDAGTLVVREVEEPKPEIPFFIAWRAKDPGRALQWFLSRLEDPDLCSALMAPLHADEIAAFA
ncbi:MAG TPA: LysR family transcriptional regulator [Burkholderiales bacterium]|nr:LysR family transcriptional regulator [Betaproteobacteria bacterium]HQR52240.1 LysR family transcriptional regulator [Burkholderiales bacterium]